MSKKITFYLPVWAEYSVTVDVEDEAFKNEEFDDAVDEAYDNLPTGLCYGCSTGNSGAGWGTPSSVNLELGDAPEVKYALDEDGNVVWGDRDAKLGW